MLISHLLISDPYHVHRFSTSLFPPSIHHIPHLFLYSITSKLPQSLWHPPPDRLPYYNLLFSLFKFYSVQILFSFIPETQNQRGKGGIFVLFYFKPIEITYSCREKKSIHVDLQLVYIHRFHSSWIQPTFGARNPWGFGPWNQLT